MKNGKEMLQGSPNVFREYLRQDMLKISFVSTEEAKDCFEPLRSVVALKESDLRNDKIITSLKNGHNDLEKQIGGCWSKAFHARDWDPELYRLYSSRACSTGKFRSLQQQRHYELPDENRRQLLSCVDCSGFWGDIYVLEDGRKAIIYYDSNGAVYREFIINSSGTIRKDPFFYRDSSGGVV